jgi:hypothetical protein
MKILVIAVAYERAIPLSILMNSFLVQTDPRWELNVIYDGEIPPKIRTILNRYTDKRIKFSNTETRNGNWGHPNRKMMLDKLEGEKDDYVLLTNDDNYYVPTFVEQMLGKASEDVGIVFCNTLHSYNNYDVHESALYECGIDMGAFIVKYPIAKKIGFNHSHLTADGRYATECKNFCIMHNLKAIHIPRAIFIHN